MATSHSGLAPYNRQRSEWDLHHSKIRRLYLEEQKTLKEVMLIIEQEDNFRAT